MNLIQLLKDKIMHVPVEASDHAAEADRFMLYIHALMAALFVGWLIYFAYALFRFRKSREPRADYHGVRSHATSNYLEIVVAGVEFVLLVGFALPLWARRATDFPKESEALNLQIMAQQFQWNTRYPGPDGKLGRQDPQYLSATNQFAIDATDTAGADDIVPPPNDIVIPVNMPVIARISSMDVIHGFAVHPLRVMQDAIPGLSIPIHFKATKEGKYMITCAQLCGNSHYAMKGNLTVVSEEAFKKWVAANSKVTVPPGGYE